MRLPCTNSDKSVAFKRRNRPKKEAGHKATEVYQPSLKAKIENAPILGRRFALDNDG